MIKKFIALLGLVILCNGCHTTPAIVTPSAAALDGNDANSGLLYQITDGGFVISDKLHTKYVSLLKKYYTNLNKENNPEIGVQKVYIITDEVMHDLLKLQTWEKNPWLIEESK